MGIYIPLCAATQSQADSRTGEVQVTPASLGVFADKIIEGHQQDEQDANVKDIDEKKSRREHDLWRHEGAIIVFGDLHKQILQVFPMARCCGFGMHSTEEESLLASRPK